MQGVINPNKWVTLVRTIQPDPTRSWLIANTTTYEDPVYTYLTQRKHRTLIDTPLVSSRKLSARPPARGRCGYPRNLKQFLDGFRLHAGVILVCTL